jgi:excisionase family DNA binding protein
MTLDNHQQAVNAELQRVMQAMADLIAVASQPGTGPTGPLAISIAEACQVTGLSRSTLHRAVKDGQLRTSNVGRRRLVTHEELKRFLKAMER